MVNTDRLCMGCMNDNGGEKICPFCGHDAAVDNPAQYLAVGTWLNANRYLTGKVIEENGDSVVYIAWDNDNSAVVNITEYLPAGLSRRSADRLTVSPGDLDAGAFLSGMEEFRTLFTDLSKLNVSGILPVVDLFESNGTLYAVTSTVSSITLKDFLIRNGGSLKWEQVKPLFLPLITTVSELHDAGIVHYGISPETVLVGRDGRLYLTGFSIKRARVANTDFSYKLASGYTAPEQYDPEAEQTASADVYALSALLFRCVIGAIPPDAKERLENDKLAIPSSAAENVSKGALVAIASALKIDVETRISTADRLKKMVEAANSVAPAEEGATPQGKKKKRKSANKYAIISALITAVVFVLLTVVIVLFFGGKGDEEGASSNNSSTVAPPIFSQTEIKYDDQGIEVPDWIGKTYTEVMDEVKDKKLELAIIPQGKVYSNEYARGQIVEQSVKNTKVEPNSEIYIYISLGKSSLTMPNLIGLTPEEAKIRLFEEGFLSENIEFRERITDGASNEVTGCTVKTGDLVPVDERIIIDFCPEMELPEDENQNDTDLIP